MELEVATYEQSLALKELGFPQFITSLTSFYYKDDKSLVKKNYDYDFIPDYPMKCVAPSLELVAKWLRKEKKIHIEVLEYVNEDRPVDISYIVNIYYNLDGYRYATYIDTPLDDLIKAHSYESKNWSDEQYDFYYNEMENHKYFIDYEDALSVAINKAIELLKNEVNC